MIYLDANAIIRLVEGDPAARSPVEARVTAAREQGPFLATSRLSLLECRCKPLGAGDTALLALYDTFFSAKELVIIEITASVIDAATRFRAAYNFKSPDAIHLASAAGSSASAFLTADKALARCAEVRVEIV